MRILLAAKHAPHGSNPIGGVQTWCRTVANELDARDHESYTWGPEQAQPSGRFDLGIVANASDTSRVLDQCDKIVSVSHGIIAPEKPLDGVSVAFTSEGVRDHWNVDGTIIRQPIDTEFWRAAENVKINLTFFSYRRALPFMKPLAKALAHPFYHLRAESADRARDIIRKSSIVLATGRAALEAMACEVPVVILDNRSAYQTPLMDDDLNHAIRNNYSGRGGIRPTLVNVREAIEEVIAKGSQRDHVLEHHDARQVVDQLLALA